MQWSPEKRRLDWLVARPIAHRGLHDAQAGIIENTAGAFGRAIDHGYAIECDLRLAGDGEAVVFHDETLDRLMAASGPIRAHATGELKSLAFRACGERIQTLAELLEQVAGKVALIIELKSHWDGDETLAMRSLDVLSAYRGAHALMSFDPDLVEAVRLRSPATVRGIVAERVAEDHYACLPAPRRLELRHFGHVGRTKPHFVSFQWEALPMEPVSAMRSAGVPVLSWTIRDRSAAAKALRYSDQITFEGFLA